ncbi:uncharacterized protein PHACADRAFT_262852 [Phanerochaete carnosa HHB-10118-sp]|uniref:Uncharacterized protein n=1 Tax=Phanerochaete carnosa (strain HHB-10118-sp) TaxID=650164 RepID=K5WL04_PHACS|nr:uncharacterized protein PHACADRAFT_262852 [Phanerochaete carnosa HHB-10118-sp]EKM50947.1 hypothetical protein PHACADRAFT_262852 [Phanerochaete carnosa HHB-10118-sp]
MEETPGSQLAVASSRLPPYPTSGTLGMSDRCIPLSENTDRPAPEASPTPLRPEPAQHLPQAEHSLRPGVTRAGPADPAPSVNSGIVSRTTDSANPNLTGPPAHGIAQPFVQNFLRGVFPPLSAPDIVRRFVDAGIVERMDLVACSQLPERDQLEMLRADLGLNILHSRMVRVALSQV